MSAHSERLTFAHAVPGRVVPPETRVEAVLAGEGVVAA